MTGKAKSGSGADDGNSYYMLDKKSKQKTELRKLIVLNELSFDKDLDVHLMSETMNDEFTFLKEIYNQIPRKGKPLEKEVLRVMLSLQQGERLSEEQWNEVILAYGEELGYDFSKHQYALYLHNDTNNQHIHLQINRVDLEAKYVIQDHNIGKKTELICEKLGKKFGLKINPSKKQTPRDEVRRTGREGKNDYVKSVIDSIINDGYESAAGEKLRIQHVFDLKKILERFRIEMNIKQDSNNKVVGTSYQYDGDSFTGQNVGKKTKELLNQINHSKNKPFINALRSIKVVINDSKLVDERRLTAVDKLRLDNACKIITNTSSRNRLRLLMAAKEGNIGGLMAIMFGQINNQKIVNKLRVNFTSQSPFNINMEGIMTVNKLFDNFKKQNKDQNKIGAFFAAHEHTNIDSRIEFRGVEFSILRMAEHLMHEFAKNDIDKLIQDEQNFINAACLRSQHPDPILAQNQNLIRNIFFFAPENALRNLSVLINSKELDRVQSQIFSYLISNANKGKFEFDKNFKEEFRKIDLNEFNLKFKKFNEQVGVNAKSLRQFYELNTEFADLGFTFEGQRYNFEDIHKMLYGNVGNLVSYIYGDEKDNLGLDLTSGTSDFNEDDYERIENKIVLGEYGQYDAKNNDDPPIKFDEGGPSKARIYTDDEKERDKKQAQKALNKGRGFRR